VGYDARSNLGKHRVVCGFSWLLRVIYHEAVLMDPKLFSSWVHRSLVLLKRGLDSASHSAAGDKGHTGALYSKNSDPAAEAGVVLFTTVLGLYGAVSSKDSLYMNWCLPEGAFSDPLLPVI
jgi:hypothetical protein